MKKKLLALILSTTVIFTMLAGCTSEDTSNEQSEAVDTGADEVEDGKDSTSGEVIEISFSHFANEGHNMQEVIEDAIARYNADHADVQLVPEVMAAEPYLVQIPALGAADDLPDLFMSNGSMSGTFGNNGVVLPLTDLIAEYGIDDVMYESAWTEHTKNGEIYAVPFFYDNYGYILYNEAIFEEAGVEEFPTTLEEFNEACDLIEAAGYIPMALGGKSVTHLDAATFSTFVNRYTGTEWFDSILAMDGTANFTDAEFIKALTDWQQLALDGTFNEDFVSIDNNERGVVYMNGEAAMISALDWECKVICETSPDVAAVTKVAAWPGPAEDEAAGVSVEQSCAWAFGVGANIDEEKIPYVMEFLADYVVTQEFGQLRIEGSNNYVPWDVDFDESKVNDILVMVKETVSSYEPCTNWDSILPGEIKVVYQRGLQELLVETITPEKLAEDMQLQYELLQ